MGMRAMVVLVVALCLVGTMPAVAFAADTGSASGRVLDAVTNAPLEGVRVVAEMSAQTEAERTFARFEVTTAADGTYRFGMLLASKLPTPSAPPVLHPYRFSFVKAGYTWAEKPGQHVEKGGNKALGDIALLAVPAEHGVYAISDDDAIALQRFAQSGGLVTPAQAPTYTALPRGVYNKTETGRGPDGQPQFLREFVLPADATIPVFTHRVTGMGGMKSGQALLIRFDPAVKFPMYLGVTERVSAVEGERRFDVPPAGIRLKEAPEVPVAGARMFIVFTQNSLMPQSGYLNLSEGTYSIIFDAGQPGYIFQVADYRLPPLPEDGEEDE